MMSSADARSDAPRVAQRRAADVFDLCGRVAFVTGAGRGVGREIALTLAANGAAVAVNDVDQELAAGVADEVRSGGGIAMAAVADVVDYRAVAGAVDAASRQLGPVTILVNNAGNAGADGSLSARQPFWETEPSDWSRWIDVNLYGLLNATRAAWAGMQAAGHGRIILIGSDAGRVGEPALAVYSAAKAGAAGFIRAIARAGGRFGITANCIALGVMDTPASEDFLADASVVDRVLRQYVIRRVGQPADAAWLALYLASDAAGWVTAQTVPVNGGYSSAT